MIIELEFRSDFNTKVFARAYSNDVGFNSGVILFSASISLQYFSNLCMAYTFLRSQRLIDKTAELKFGFKILDASRMSAYEEGS